MRQHVVGGPHDNDLACIRDTDELSALDHERYYSDPPADSELAKPAEPTSCFLEQCDE